MVNRTPPGRPFASTAQSTGSGVRFTSTDKSFPPLRTGKGRCPSVLIAACSDLVSTHQWFAPSRCPRLRTQGTGTLTIAIANLVPDHFRAPWNLSRDANTCPRDNAIGKFLYADLFCDIHGLILYSWKMSKMQPLITQVI